MAAQVSKIMWMSRQELDALYASSPPGQIPIEDARGTAIVFPGTLIGVFASRLIRWFVWQGKVFDPVQGCLVNKVTPFRIKAIKAKVYKGRSWADDKETIVLDYSKTSVVARKIRDEIREVAPGVYLGPVYWGQTKLVHFALVPQGPGARGSDWWGRLVFTLVLLMAIAAGYLIHRFRTDQPVTYSNIEDHFKYGSTGGERTSGIPYAIWRVLPTLFRDYLPGPGYESLGFIYEPGQDLPIGVSKRNVQGLDRVFLNCAVCHTSTVRDTPESPPRIILGMPANGFDLARFEHFVFQCVADERFTPARVTAEAQANGGDLDIINRAALRYYGVYAMRDRLLTIGNRFKFMDRQPDWGPGRVDTFNSAKVLLNFPMEQLPEREWIGTADFPSIWLQKPRKTMQLHWDGNNTDVHERNLSAAFGTGAFPPTVDLESIGRVEDWLWMKTPPDYPYEVDSSLAARGQPIYDRYCADCHGRNGRDFSGSRIGQVTPIDVIGTDRHRLDSYSPELSSAQNTLYAGYPWRFKSFRKTFGYANMPLDGVWLRAPYLHNGSVPTLRDLLNPAAQRPESFTRGSDIYDRTRVGFVSNDVPEQPNRPLFRFDTSLPGNGRQGHEGYDYGTELPDAEKDALVEYLKTF